MDDPATLREAAASILSGLPVHASHTLNFGLGLVALFNSSGVLGDIESAIQLLRMTRDLRYEDLETHFGLGTALLARYERLGEVNDIVEAAAFLRLCEGWIPVDDEERSTVLMTLSRALGSKFERTGDLADIEDAIRYGQESFACATDDSEKVTALYSTARAYHARFQRFGELEDLHLQISSLESAVELTPNDDFDKGTYLSSLSVVLKQRFDWLGDPDDLTRAIDTAQAAVAHCSNDHPERPTLLNNLGASLLARFYNLGSDEDLTDAINYLSQAAEVMPDDHALKQRLRVNLGIALQNRFEHRGDVIDISRAIEVMHSAVEHTVEDHSTRAMLLKCLGLAYRARYHKAEQLPDIELSISYHRQSIALTPEDHPERAHRLNDLCVAYLHRHARLLEPDDIAYAVEVQEEAVSLTQDGHIEKAIRLNHLSLALRLQSQNLGTTDTLRRAIEYQGTAVELMPDAHVEKPLLLSNYAVLLAMLPLDNAVHLDRAIDAIESSLTLSPENYRYRASLLNNCAALYLHRYSTGTTESQDVERTLALCQQALVHAPVGDVNRVKILSNLAFAFRCRFERQHQPNDFDAAIDTFRDTVTQTAAFPKLRLHAAVAWVEIFDALKEPTNPKHFDADVLEAHRHVIDLISQYIWIGQQLEMRYVLAHKIAAAVNKAVGAAIGFGQLELAVEWLEAGRGVIWGQLLQLRTPLDDLQRTHPHLASQFNELAKALEITGVTYDNAPYAHQRLSEPIIIDPQSVSLGEQGAIKRRELALRYEALLQEIRSQPGFDQFLRPKAFSDLRHAAQDGPIVMLNVAESRCDALILFATGDLCHVPLYPLTQIHALEMRRSFVEFLRISNVLRGREPEPELGMLAAHSMKDDGSIAGERATSLVGNPPGTCMPVEDVLRALWQHVVHPILQKLQGTAVGAENAVVDDRLLHITWCPTGPLASLPFHGAGVYDGNDSPKIFHYAVSSYTPSLTTLLKDRSRPHQSNPHRKALVVSQPNTPGYTRLPGTTKEAAMIRKHLPDILQLDGRDATAETLLVHMVDHNWVHLACHGVQNTKLPAESAFILDDGPLSLVRLMNHSTENAELAFLSACQTATGEEHLPEESVHLAAGMLVGVGYSQVVATMWSICDADGPLVADAFYARLVNDYKTGGGGRVRAAYALHDAVARLRESERVGEKSFERWMPFVHFGN